MSPEHLDRLEEELAREPYLEDGGFTARVMGRLPPPRRARATVLALSGLAAAAIGAATLPGLVADLLRTAAAGPAWLPAGGAVAVGATLALGAAAGLGRLLLE
jgi:hypothetical protein